MVCLTFTASMKRSLLKLGARSLQLDSKSLNERRRDFEVLITPIKTNADRSSIYAITETTWQKEKSNNVKVPYFNSS